MNLQWIQIELIDPVVAPLYPVCDFLLGWTTRLGGVWGVVVVGLLTGLGVNLFQKFFSRQKLLGKCKADLKKLKKFTAEAKKAGNDERVTQLMNVSKRVSGKYMWGSLKPAIFTVPPVLVICMWTWVRLGFDPVGPDKEIEVVACFENEARGYATMLASRDDVEIIGGRVAPITKWVETPKEKKKRAEAAKRAKDDGPVVLWKPWTWFNATPLPDRGLEAHWRVRAKREGEHKITIRYPTEEGMKSCEIDFPAFKGKSKPPEFITYLVFDTPGMDHMQTVQFDLKDSMPADWWNLWFQWMGLYILVAIASGVGFRFLFRVN